eukprot:CAMPEP_0195141560 /NCGR_PEP_ID=MMETSP0448-20130528/163124_1 /TAXON_ID=66468 /ORGANISM="Heterocapsa triquestra, Strain CCMP 448" /LENGTH=64 /DNA_ID=CAMNT_0040179939 /DNA_START=54 /DNA_END=245 /DNA_ORIENTATION=-
MPCTRECSGRHASALLGSPSDMRDRAPVPRGPPWATDHRTTQASTGESQGAGLMQAVGEGSGRS